MTDKSFEGKVALVTGATRGIGAAVALSLVDKGAHVIFTGRTESKLEEMDNAIRFRGGCASFVPLDITDYDGIDRLGAHIYDKWGKLDILVGNAGELGPVSPIPHITPKDWDKIFAINSTANFRLIRSMDLLLRQADRGRAVFVTTSVASLPRAHWGAYAASKAALESFVKTYALENIKHDLKVNLLNPGPIRTAMRAKAIAGEDPMTLDTPHQLAPMFLKMLSDDFQETAQTFSYKSYKNAEYNW
jgi:NAD(P)-dependent dehydrogenase (short-subunit alcohol dehydrogenase family)